MAWSNLYESVYKNLEKDVLALLESIYLCDDHLKVYLIKITELILRCGSEIEAISKELYCDNVTEGNREELRFDFDCLKWLFGLATLNCTEKKRSWYTSRHKKEGENHGRKTDATDLQRGTKEAAG